MREWALRAIQWGVWPLLLTPVGILLHEAAHLAVALAVGVPEPKLHFSSISYGDVSDLPGWAMALTGAAGPLMTLVLTLVGCLFAAKSHSPRWAFGLAASASSRLLLGLPFALLGTISAMLGYGASTAFDEFKAATAVGLPGLPFVVLTAACGVAAFVFIVRRLSHLDRWAALPGLVLGTILGWGLWLVLLGPLLLP